MQDIGIAKEQKPLRRIATAIVGWFLVLAGILGMFLPIVPGGFLLVVGVLLLGPRCGWLRRALEKCRTRFPALERAVRQFSKLRRGLAEPSWKQFGLSRIIDRSSR